MDADILVLNRPDEIIEWIENGGKPPFLLGQPPTRTPDKPIDQAPRHMQEVFRNNVPALNAAVRVPVEFLDGTTSGFYGCRDELSLEKAQEVLSACLKLNTPMFEWGGEQCLVIYLLSMAGGKRLDPAHYFNFFPDLLGKLGTADAVHFFGTHRFFKNAYCRAAARIVNDLGRSSRTVA